MSDIRVKDGFKVAAPGGNISWTVGQIIAPDGTVAQAFEPRVIFRINAIAADAGGMNLATQRALMEAVELTLKTNVGTKAARTPIEKETLGKLTLDTNSLLERDVIGGPGDATSIGDEKGLGGALVVGENRLVVVLPVSLGHIEHVTDSRKLWGAGVGQMERMELSYKFARDVAKALESNVECVGYEVDLRIITQRTNSDGEPECLVPHIETVKGGERDAVTTPDGLVLTGNDTDTDLEDTLITQIEVSQGGQVVTREAEPKDIQARYLNMPNTKAIEVGVANARTPLLRIGDSSLRDIKPGRVVVTMEDHDKDLNTRWALLPLYDYKNLLELLAAQAARLKNGGYVHMVNAAGVENVDVGDEHLPFTGWRYFTMENKRYHTMAGLRMRKDGEPFIFVPPTKLLTIATEYGLASQDPDATAAKAGALSALVQGGWDIPGIVTSSAGAPPLGEETPIFRVFQRMVTDYREDMNAARARQAEPTVARRKALQAAGRDPNELYAIPWK